MPTLPWIVGGVWGIFEEVAYALRQPGSLSVGENQPYRISKH
ncbi:hypothetical protein [Thermostichus sp. OS-CIW-26]